MRRAPRVTLAIIVAAACEPSAPPARVAAEPPQLFAPARAAPAAKPEERTRLAAALGEVERAFIEYFETHPAPGIALGIVGRGGLVWSRAAGVRDLGTGAPVTDDTVFRVGSVTKLFTGLALLQLRDEGRLSMDTPLVRYLPEAAGVIYPTRDSPLITLRHVVTHTSGLPVSTELAYRAADGGVPTDEQLLGALCGAPLGFSPGTDGEYSNLAAAVAGMVIGRVAGTSYASYVERGLLLPLGMRSSGFAPGPGWRDRLATGYRAGDGGWQPAEVTAPGPTDAVGHLYTSLADLSRFAAFELSAWPPRDEPDAGPVRRSTVRESQLLEGPARPGATGYGVFWRVFADCGGAHVVSHEGRIDGFYAVITLAPELGVGVIALANARTPDGLEPFVARALTRLALAQAGDIPDAASPCAQ